MSTRIGALAGLVVGAGLGIGGMMILQQDSMMDHGTMAGMGDMPMTGNPDHDFMAGMVPHHQAAVDMANDVLANGTDPEVRALAQTILQSQQAEIDEMNDWLAANPVQN
ncbi:DUF305 domain-containing protein [Loktanella sp. TSTF-M6]|uniref:DUF305 domain-containing protein n=1 Tax=Loktanella gaetbuli TaxID=2881335 RepID=A0ABS8BVR1_9RHOB|nr:DUF305 domain-containing protein [Loktanella gaetbuli]MCB5199826.1 DUF305 domain-containing protein [Loktanella gaetbuli]